MGRGAFKGAVQVDNLNDTVDVADRAARDLGKIDVAGADSTLPVEQQTAVDIGDRTAREIGKARIQDSGGVLVDPLDAGDMGPFHDRVTAVATYATVNPGAYGSTATIVADTTGAATLTVEVSNDGATWDAYTVDIADAGGAREEVAGYAYVRAQVDANLNGLQISAKGV